ncbi:uncharacterized protein LOC133193464 [Saccostrea echinata]|uniref:uncharacterized protein LOC133193464 n=1 Tax=Saccostrea echinata TaxID=191078 RepID=UPI002A7FD438|nr:uncharacterized protein LOC133193464 [Saccostrea echinata]
MDIATLSFVLTIIHGAFSTHLTGNGGMSGRVGSLRQSSRASFSNRGSSSNRRVPVISSAELRAIYRAREIRRQQRLLEQQKQLAQLSQLHSNRGSQQNLLSQLLTPQQQQPQPQSQQQIAVSNDLLQKLLLTAILGNDLNTAASRAQGQTQQQSANSVSGNNAAAKTAQNTNNNPVVIEANGNIRLSEVKKPNGQTHIVIDTSNMGVAGPLTVTLKPGEDPPEPEIKLPFGHRK